MENQMKSFRMQTEKCHCFLSVLSFLKFYKRHLLHQAVATIPVEYRYRSRKTDI